MSLHRKAIRRAIAEALVGKTTAKERVSCNRAEKVWSTGFPAILIYTKSERCEIKNEAVRKYMRTLSVHVCCLVSATSEQAPDDLGDDLGQQVEDRLLHDLTFEKLKHVEINKAGAKLVSCDLDVQLGDLLFAGWDLVFEIPYVTTVVPPDQRTLSPLEAFDVDWDFPPPDTELEAEDEIKVPVV